MLFSLRLMIYVDPINLGPTDNLKHQS